MSIQRFTASSVADLANLEHRLNAWLSSQDCWVKIETPSIWETDLQGNRWLDVEFKCESDGPAKSPPRIRAKVLFGDEKQVEQFLGELDLINAFYQVSSIIPTLNGKDDNRVYCVLLYRARVERIAINYGSPVGVSEQIQRILDKLAPGQVIDSLTLVNNNPTSLTIDFGISPFLAPLRNTPYGFKREIHYQGGATTGSFEDLTQWADLKPNLPGLSGKFSKFPRRILSLPQQRPGSDEFWTVFVNRIVQLDTHDVELCFPSWY